MQIFGKSAQDLNPLILGGANALKQLGDDADSAGAANNVLAGTFAGGMKSTVDTSGKRIFY